MAQYLNGRLQLSYILKSPRDYASWASFRRDVEAVARAGYRGIEIPMHSPDDFRISDMQAVLEDCGLRLAGIQTGSAYLNSGVCLAARDAAVRAGAEDLLKRYIELAAGFGSTVVFGLLQGTRKEEPDSARALKRIRTHLSKLAEFAASVGAVVAIEPVNRYECAVFHNTISDVVASVEWINCSAIRAMVDTFHVNIEEATQGAAIRQAASLLAHVHLSETNRGVFGTGHMNFAAVFDALHEIDYGGFVSIGIYRDEPPLHKLVEDAMDYLQAAWDEAHA